MEKIRKQPITKTWRLMGLTGLTLSVSFFLNEGQARTLPMRSSVTVQSTYTSKIASKVRPVEKKRGSQLTKLTQGPEMITQEMDHEDKTQKKKFGLTILLLGVLGEKS